MVGLAKGLQDLGEAQAGLSTAPKRSRLRARPAMGLEQERAGPSDSTRGGGLQVTGEFLTISMIRCPHTLHLSAVCWNPEY